MRTGSIQFWSCAVVVQSRRENNGLTRNVGFHHPPKQSPTRAESGPGLPLQPHGPPPRDPLVGWVAISVNYWSWHCAARDEAPLSSYWTYGSCWRWRWRSRWRCRCRCWHGVCLHCPMLGLSDANGPFSHHLPPEMILGNSGWLTVVDLWGLRWL